MRVSRTLKSAFPFLLLLEAGHLAGPSPVQTPEKDTNSTARVCVAHDFGTPKSLVPVTTADALWHQDPARLAEGPDGMIYSTSPNGGEFGRGTIWRHDPATGKYEVLYHFPVADSTGSGSRSGLLAAKGADGKPSGTFYGSAYGGGRWGVGTIFRYTIGASKPEVLFHFRNGRMTGLVPKLCPTPTTCRYSGEQRADASAGYPTSAPVVRSDGSIYGVTFYSNNQQYGVFYKLGGGEEGLSAICIFQPSLVRDLDMAPYVCHPRVTGAGSLTVGNDGSTLFGTTTGVYGSLWSSTGGKPDVLHEFKLSDGSKPMSILQASNGNLFGTTWAGGEIGAGTLFRFATVNRSFQTLSHFKIDYYLGNFSPGLNPIGALVERLDTLNNDPSQTVRSLYGSAKFGGRGGRGTIYRIGLDGSGFKVVHHFPNSWGASGRSPLGALMLHSGGAIYGTTYQGGTFDGGALWRLTGTGMPDVPELTVPPKFTIGSIAKDAAGKELKDDMLTVRVGVCAYQILDAQGKADCMGLKPHDIYGPPEAIKFEAVGCRNAHFVQFISREEIMSATNPPQWREGTTLHGYALTTDPANPVWDVDVGSSKAADAYWDNVPHNPVIRGPFHLINADVPSMGPSAAAYDKLGMDSDIRRAVFRTYLYCNCELKRLVKWTRERKSQYDIRYTAMSLEKTTAADQEFINGLLKAQKFIPVP